MSVTPMMTDAELVAYVDGRLGVERTREIGLAANADTTLAARIGDLAAGSPDFSTLWGDMVQSVPDGLMPNLPMALGARINRRAWLSGLGGAAFGFVGGYGILGLVATPESDWETAVANYHSLYAAVTVSGLSPTVANQKAELMAVKAVSGLAVSLPVLESVTYRRAQILALDGQPIVHIVLTNADVVPIAYCLIAERGPAQGIAFRQIGEMGLVTWADGAASSLLVARLPKDQLLALAGALSG